MTRRQAKALRANLTEAERRLWYLLRAHRFKGIKFKRQALIGRYIVDFVSFERRSVIEVDGGQHAGSEADLRRDQRLEDQGFRIVRFWNNEVLKNTGSVLEAIETILRASTNPLPARRFAARHPLPQGERGIAVSEF
jgi:very-short-patch-repair endonuclease